MSESQLAGVEAIYQEAFAPDLRVPFLDLTTPGRADQTYVALENLEPVGVAVFRLLGSVGWSFLRYFAIAESRRGQALGRQFWRLVGGSLRDMDWPERVVFEVENPAEVDAEAEQVIRRRRISFWSACGARLLAVPDYVLPDYTGSGLTEPMLLMAGDQAALAPLDGELLRQLVQAIYTDRYGLSPVDPLVSQALASIPT